MKRFCINGKMIIAGLLLINMLGLSLSAFKALNTDQEDVVIQEVPLYDSQGWINSQGLFRTDYETDNYWLGLTAENVKKGVYSVSIKYDTNGEEKRDYVHLTAYGAGPSLLLSDDYLLDPYKKELKFQIWLNDTADYLQVQIDCKTAGKDKEPVWLSVTEIALRRKALGSACYAMLKTAAYLLLMDLAAAAYLLRNKWKKDAGIYVVLAGTFFLSSVGVFIDILPQGCDLAFHLSRIYGLAEGLRTGQFPVKIGPNWSNAYGYATPVFYDDIFLYFPALLVLLKLPLEAAYKIYVCMVNFGTVLTAYFCCRKISGDKYIGLAGSILYTFSIYRLCSVYFKAAVGESTAMLFFPLVILAIWKILKDDVNTKEYGNNWILLTLAVSGIIQSHVLSCEMAALFLLLVGLIAFRKFLRKERLLVLGWSIAAALCLNAAFLIPFLDYAGEDINVFMQRDSYQIQKYGLSLYEMFTVTVHGKMLQTGKGLESKLPVSLGFSLVMILLAAVMILFALREWEKEEKKTFGWAAALTGTALILSTNVFPWDRLEKISFLKIFVGNLEFPFRFLSIAVGLIVLLACLVFKKLKDIGFENGRYKIIMILLCLFSIYQGEEYIDQVIRNSPNYAKYDGTEWSADYMTVYGGEYYYKGTDYPLALKKGYVEGDCTINSVERKGITFTVDCSTVNAGYLKLPLFYYPDYRCRDTATGMRLPVIRGENNEVWVELPENYAGTLKIAFVEPWYWRGAEIVSLFTLLGMIFYAVFDSKKRKKAL